MAYYPRKPRVTEAEVVEQIKQRTGIPTDAIKRIMDAYNDIVKESLFAGTEVPIGSLGYFSWSNKVPRKHIPIHNIRDKTYELIGYKDFPGCYTPSMRWNKKWQDELKEVTRYEEVEE